MIARGQPHENERDLSVEAFTRAYRKPLHPAVQNAREVIEWEEAERASDFAQNREQERRELNRIWRAVVLSEDLDTCRELLAGRPAPLHKLRPEWLRRIRRR